MRSDSLRRRRARTLAPAAIIGTLAATLSAVPAAAVDADRDRALRHGTLVFEPASHAAPMSKAKAGASFTRAVVAERVPSRAIRTANAPASYVVRAGDTVSGIAERYGLRTADILGWNGLTGASIIYPGQTLRLAPTAAAAATTTTTASAGTHTVRGGDTLSGIAAAHDVSLSALFSANRLDYGSIIHPGQRIVIPGAPTAAPAAKPAAPVAAAPAPAPAPAAYTVRSGDTLSGIASAHGVALETLFSANGLGWGSIIYPGQRIAIPGAVGGQRAAATTPSPATAVGLDAEQTANAKLIIRVGRELGVSDRGIAIALATAMVESWIRNLDWGDRDSLGLFQQRPSTGWGSAAQIRDAERAIRVFYGGPSDPNGSRTRGLLDIPGWESMGFSQAAQSVQISAFPDRYGKWESAAYQWIAALG